MVTPAGLKARSIREILLCLYNLHVSRPNILDYVNPAFHLISGEDLSRIAQAFTARGRAEGHSPQSYWHELLNFWMLPSGLIADDASLAIKLHQFHGLVSGSAKSAAKSVPEPASPKRRRAYRRRSKRAAGSPEQSHPQRVAWLAQTNGERLVEAGSLMGQHHGVLFNVAGNIEVRAALELLEQAGSAAITKFTHELGMRIKDWAGDAGDRSFHWIYRNHRTGNVFRSHLALFVPYEHFELAEHWLARKQWEVEGAEVSVDCKFHNPQPPSPKAKRISRLRFHWKRMRELLATIDPDRLHWASNGTRQPLRDLLGIKGKASPSEPLTTKMIGVSHSLDRAARAKAEKNKMTLLSAFRDLAWDRLDDGWELDEYRDRITEAAAREDQIRRIEFIGDDPGPLARQRHAEELEALLSRWSDDPHERPRTWIPWVPKSRETQ